MTDETTHLRALLADEHAKRCAAELDHAGAVALLAEQTARAERAEADEQRWRQAVAMLLRHEPETDVRSLLDGIVYDVPDHWCRVAERDAALAANAEMRAALDHYAHREYESRRDADGQIQHIAAEVLSRPDLGAGVVVVPREVVIGARNALRVADRLRRLAVKVVCLPRSIVDSVEAPASLLQAIDDMNRDEADFERWEGKLDALLKRGGG